MVNALHPDKMSATERLDEVGRLLATGLIRLRARKSRPLSTDRGESSLALSHGQSGHEEDEIRLERGI